MKSHVFAAAVLAFTFIWVSSGYAQQTAEQLYQAGLYEEEIKGELEAAIELFEKIIVEYPEDRPFVAKALLHIGMCYEKLGSQVAQNAYQRIVSEFPDQIEVVNEARARLAALSKELEATAHKPTFRKIRIPTKLSRGAQLSPDGKKLAFASEGGIWVVPVPGKVGPDIVGKPIKLTEPTGFSASEPVWSGDGKWIAFNLWDKGDAGIAIIPSTGGEPKIVPVKTYRGGMYRGFRISLSPDGKLLAYASGDGNWKFEDASIKQEKYNIYTIPVDGGAAVRLTDAYTLEPAFSPDGKKIAYDKQIRTKEGKLSGLEIWVTPVEGGDPIQVSDSSMCPLWSPYGNMIAFLCYVSEKDKIDKELRIVPISKDGKPEAAPTRIKLPGETNDYLAGWTTDNKIGILFEAPEHRALYTVPASGEKATQITPNGIYYDPRWSPDGMRILFGDDGNISSVPAEGGKVSTIYSDTNFVVTPPGGGPTISPDGKTIVFSGFRKDSPERKKGLPGVNIWTIPVEGGEPKQLTKGFYNPRWPCWSPDGKSIAFVNYLKKSNIYIITAEGEQAKQLTTESDKVFWSSIGWSPDGKWIAYFSEDKTIKIKPVHGGEPRTVTKIDELNYYKELTWAPDSRKLAYTSFEHIWIVSLDGGEPTKVKTGLDGRFAKISWSPDGKTLAFTAEKGGDIELWLMEDFMHLVKVAK